MVSALDLLRLPGALRAHGGQALAGSMPWSLIPPRSLICDGGRVSSASTPLPWPSTATPRPDASGYLLWSGGKAKTEIRNATPTEFRDVLLTIAEAARSS